MRINVILSAKDIQASLAKPALSFPTRTTIWLCWMAISFSLFGYGLAGVTCGSILLGLAIAHGVELCHQALHRSGFKSIWMNTVFGYMFGFPMLVSYKGYRKNHLYHHRMVGTPLDSEFFDYGEHGLRPMQFLINLSMIKHYSRYLVRCGLEWASLFASPKMVDPKVERDSFYLVSPLLLLGLSGLLIASGQAIYVVGYLFALVVVAGPVHYLIEFPEHYACDFNSEDVFENTRTILTNKLMNWFVNGNNYHVEHHLIEAASLENAAAVHGAIRGRHKHIETGYISFYRKVLSGGFDLPQPLKPSASTSERVGKSVVTR